MSFTYNDGGLRTSKTSSGVTTKYYYDGDLLIKEETPSYTIVYVYDISGVPLSFRYRSNSYEDGVWDIYYYERNLQNDIIAVYNSAGTKLISYKYTAYGKTTVSYSNSGSSTTATKNSLRYRGYYYDSDLGFYYLQSRYYDPNTCRFINADGALYHSMLGYNMFAYCNNNPVMYIDPTGEFSEIGLLLTLDPSPLGELIIAGFVLFVAGAIIVESLDTIINYLEEKAEDAKEESQDSTESSDKVSKPNSTKNGMPRNLPKEGEPNTDQNLYDEDGIKQTRHYGPDGKAEYDIDYRHGGNYHEFPHTHYWDWSKYPPIRSGHPPLNIYPN